MGKVVLFLSVLVSCSMASCSLAPLRCLLTFSDYRKTYTYNFSKEELKNKIIETYSYNKSLFSKNLGRTIIENKEVNQLYRKSVDVWLDKGNWDAFKSEIREHTRDTLNLTIGKHHSRREIEFQIIIQGDSNKSSLTIHGFKYKQFRHCKKNTEYYLLKISDKIEDKFIEKLQ
jgi:hypothetical protein